MENEVKTILISPHCDDIAFSIGGTIASGFFEQTLKIVTVFSKSSYAPCLKKNSLESISIIRNTEENKYAEIIGAKLDILQFPDSSLRGYVKDQLDEYKEDDIISDPFFEEIHNSLLNIISSHQRAEVVCPLGIGNHIDHLLVSTICTRLCIENNKKMMYYEDLPYAADITLKEIRQRVDYLSNKYGIDIKPCKVNIIDDLDYKANNLRIYKSQICIEKEISKVKIHSTRIGFKSENIIDSIWQFPVSRYLFKRFYLNVNPRLYERVWKIKT